MPPLVPLVLCSGPRSSLIGIGSDLVVYDIVLVSMSLCHAHTNFENLEISPLCRDDSLISPIVLVSSHAWDAGASKPRDPAGTRQTS